jgi:transglutaminase-like putative cysteine protease
MMDNSGNNGGERPQVKSPSNWPMVVGIVVAVVVLLAAIGVLAWKLGWLSNFGPFSKWSTPEVIELNPSVSSDEAISRQYEWSYDGTSYKLTLPIPEDIYDYYSRMERAPVEDYSIYVTHPDDDAELVHPLAAELKRLAVQKGYDQEETVNFAASFVQNLNYQLEPEGEEYPKYPVETLVDKAGDCEDMAILTAALLQSMGYDAVLIRFSPTNERDAGHMAVGVAVTGVSGGYSYTYDGEKYYYLETTSPWPVGEMPPDILSTYKGKSDAIYDLVRVPALRFANFTWGVNSSWFSNKTAYLEVTVTNWGTANADAFYVRAFFEGHEDGAKQSATYDLAYGYQISGVATRGIVVPSGGGTLSVELWLGGEVVDDWTASVS